MRRNDERGGAVEANQAERAQAVNADGAGRHILLLRRERM
jgi:hypothetical protein